MKQDIFTQYAELVCDVFEISEADLFKKSKKRDLVDARQLLYYLCHKRPLRIGYIQKYMCDNGYDITHSTIIHGINIVADKVANDSDYVKMISKMEKAVSL